MGLERTAAAVQGKASVYETDLFAPLIEQSSRLAGKVYGKDETTDRAIRIVAEHGRAITFLIADGIVPSNEGRGYVLRRVLRRAFLFGRKLDREKRFLEDIAEEVINKMKHVYPELEEKYAPILTVIDEEDKRFHDTLDFGLNLFDVLLRGYESEAEKTISGQDAFHFYDTYGLPREVLAEVAEQGGFEVDWEGFEAEMERQRERARAAQKSVTIDTKLVYSSADQAESKFIGYKKLTHDSSVEWLGYKGKSQYSVSEGKEVDVVIKETPFYGEMGGQVGDTGEIRGDNSRIVVANTFRTPNDTTINHGKVVEGTISVGDAVEAIVDEARRLDIARNHTATHLLQAALRQVLGTQVQQAGSLVAPERLRFDFTHVGTISKEQLNEVQRIVNERVRQNLPVRSKIASYSEAIAQGALALFGEKYGEKVRVLEIGEPVISAELCGGTHVNSTGEIGLFLIVGESSIGAGIRRIEAVTGRGAEELVETQLSIVEEATKELRVSASEIRSRISALQTELDAERKKAISLERELLRNSVDSLLSKAESIAGITVLAAKVPASNMESLRYLGDLIKERLGSVVVVLAAAYNNRANFVAMVTPDLVARGLNAGQIVKQVAAVAGGSGGGRAELGQAGGKDKRKIDEALKLVRRLIEGKG
jgi:alanyl-tRNA synthetase